MHDAEHTGVVVISPIIIITCYFTMHDAEHTGDEVVFPLVIISCEVWAQFPTLILQKKIDNFGINRA